jgi:hypothetical protein
VLKRYPAREQARRQVADPEQPFSNIKSAMTLLAAIAFRNFWFLCPLHGQGDVERKIR